MNAGVPLKCILTYSLVCLGDTMLETHCPVKWMMSDLISFYCTATIFCFLMQIFLLYHLGALQFVSINMDGYNSVTIWWDAQMKFHYLPSDCVEIVVHGDEEGSNKVKFGDYTHKLLGYCVENHCVTYAPYRLGCHLEILQASEHVKLRAPWLFCVDFSTWSSKISLESKRLLM